MMCVGFPPAAICNDGSIWICGKMLSMEVEDEETW